MTKRDFKFRAWDEDDKEMITPDDVAEMRMITTVDMQVEDRITVEQYTGMKDIDGVEIYEGDILSIGGINVFADWYDGQFILNHKNQFFAKITSEHLNECTVIGNIHENKELLEV